MSVLTRPAVLLATASMAAGLLVAPSAAYAADTTTNLTEAEMKVALQAVSRASATAGAGGWKARMTATMPNPDGGTITITDTTVVDPVHGLYSEALVLAGYGTTMQYAAQGRGLYEQVDSSREQSALRMMGRSSVRFVFTADKGLRLADVVKENAPDPAVIGEEMALAGTKTVHDDGSADFRVVHVEGGDRLAVTLHAGPTSVLTGLDVEAVGSDASSEIGVDYSYGAQKVNLPAASATIDNATMAKGVAYLGMATVVKNAATKGAADTRKAARGGTVKVVALRKVVRRDAAAVNKAAGVAMVKVKDISGGVRVFATNPWTKKTVAYTVKASGKRVLLKKV